MSTSPRPASVAILALPETGVSTVYGMFDLFMAAGRDWGIITQGVPGPQLIAPRIVAQQAGPFAAGNGVVIQANCTLAECEPGSAFRLVRVFDQSPEFLRFLTETGLSLGVEGTVVSRATAAGTVTVRLGDDNTTLGLSAAEKILVDRPQ